MGTPNYDLPTLYADLDQFLVKAQHHLEQAIEAYGEAGDFHAEKQAEYRRAKASTVKQLREEKHPIGVINDLSQGMVADMKEAEMKAEYRAKQARMLIESITERINTMKYIGRASQDAGAK